MAILDSSIHFTGSIGNLSGYTRKGSGKHYLRSKGGASKHQIYTAPEFELTRQNAREFAGCSKAASSIRQAMFPVSHLHAPNFNIITSGVTIVKAIQEMDKTGSRGNRQLLFSTYRHLLEGFNLNTIHPFDSIVLSPVTCTIDRKAGTAQVQLPHLYLGANLQLPWTSPMYRLVVHLGALNDFIPSENSYQKTPGNKMPKSVPHVSPWHFAQEPFTGYAVLLQLQQLELLQEHTSLLVSIGIEMGVPVTSHLVQAQRYQGAGKILKAG